MTWNLMIPVGFWGVKIVFFFGGVSGKTAPEKTRFFRSNRLEFDKTFLKKLFFLQNSPDFTPGGKILATKKITKNRFFEKFLNTTGT
jgi:hypothetical protein